jgi:hypothetical protein
LPPSANNFSCEEKFADFPRKIGKNKPKIGMHRGKKKSTLLPTILLAKIPKKELICQKTFSPEIGHTDPKISFFNSIQILNPFCQRKK